MPKPELDSKPLPVACFAPPLTDEKLVAYRAVVAGLTGDIAGPRGLVPAAKVRDAMTALLMCVEAWWALPESKSGDGPKLAIRHRSKDAKIPITLLEPEYVKALWDVTPWMEETFHLASPEPATEKGLFHDLPPGPLKKAAFDLLWHVREITLDREPLTMDRLPE